jgi:UDPglucose--hexose-1-phosphate uridylyltransferase
MMSTVTEQTVRRTTIRMADGRELIYYDSDPTVVRDAVDRRVLPPRPEAPQMRFDALSGEWIAVAAARQTRVMLPSAAECPLCPTTPWQPTEIPSAYEIVVFENRSPSFATGPTTLDEGLPPMTLNRVAAGRCEVVCFTDDHDASLAALPPSRVRLLLDVWTDRTAVLSARPDVAQVFCYENRGVEIGVTLHHPHGQIYAYPFVTPRTAQMDAAAAAYAAANGGRNVFADMLDAERRLGTRVVASNEHWTAFVPAAARWPFEVRLAPHRLLGDLTELSADERDAFPEIYLDLLKRFDGLFGVPMPYISAWHQAPVAADRSRHYLHLQLFSIRRAVDKLKYLAGSESAMGAFVNDVLPERAAALLRDAR